MINVKLKQALTSKITRGKLAEFLRIQVSAVKTLDISCGGSAWNT